MFYFQKEKTALTLFTCQRQKKKGWTSQSCCKSQPEFFELCIPHQWAVTLQLVCVVSSQCKIQHCKEECIKLADRSRNWRVSVSPERKCWNCIFHLACPTVMINFMSVAVIAAQLLTSWSQLLKNKFGIKYLHETIKTCFKLLLYIQRLLIWLPFS